MTDVRVVIPATRVEERRYVFDWVLRERMGLSYEMVSDPFAGDVRLVLPNGCAVIVHDELFAAPAGEWGRRKSLPRPPFDDWTPASFGVAGDTSRPSLPVLYADSSRPAVRRTDVGDSEIGIDIFGTIFFLLTRYEEWVSEEEDAHGRFPQSASVFAEAEALLQPVADDYVAVLREVLSASCPALPIKDSVGFRVWSTHDVDHPWLLSRIPSKNAARSLARGVRHGEFGPSLRRIGRWSMARFRGDKGDPAFTFKWIMETADAAGLPCAFNFIPDPVPIAREEWSTYELNDPTIAALMRDIHERGHEIGVHPSYDSLDNDAQLRAQVEQVKNAALRLGITQPSWGSRQHFLRWTSKSPAAIREIGIDYDSTLGFAETPGFRAGTCHSFRLFDLDRSESSEVRERPLILMDTTLSPAYASIDPGSDEAFALIGDLRRSCRIAGGEFVILWHNNSFVAPAHRRLYRYALSGSDA